MAKVGAQTFPLPRLERHSTSVKTIYEKDHLNKLSPTARMAYPMGYKGLNGAHLLRPS